MPANVETMMYAGEVPWHGLGTAVPENVPWQQAIEAAGLAWEVGKRRMFIRDVRDNGVTQTPVEVPDAHAIVRMTDSTVLGVVGARYSVVQNRDAFATFGEFFGDAAVLQTAGSLDGGRVVWGLAESPEPFTIGKDEHRKFLLVSSTHDGSGALRVYPTAVRVVCSNTLAASRADKDGGIAVRHTGDPVARLAEKASVLAQAFGFFDAYAAKGKVLLERILTESEEREIVSELVNAATTHGQHALDAILDAAHHGAGNAPYAGTGYALFQGVTDYVDHGRMPSQAGEARFASTVLGSGAALKTHALEVILAATGGRPAPTNQAPTGGLLSEVLAATPGA